MRWAACGGDDSNALSAALAVAIGNELGRWDVNTDFAIVGSKLELSATGKLHCVSKTAGRASAWTSTARARGA
jgi:hypothetical protein